MADNPSFVLRAIEDVAHEPRPIPESMSSGPLFKLIIQPIEPVMQ